MAGAFVKVTCYPFAKNDTLLALIGTTNGWDGATTFALPNVHGCVPIHMGMEQGLSSQTLDFSKGTVTTTLSVANMPAHMHAIDAMQLLSSPLSATLTGSGTILDGKHMNMTNTVCEGTSPLSTSAVGGHQ